MKKPISSKGLHFKQSEETNRNITMADIEKLKPALKRLHRYDKAKEKKARNKNANH